MSRWKADTTCNQSTEYHIRHTIPCNGQQSGGGALGAVISTLFPGPVTDTDLSDKKLARFLPWAGPIQGRDATDSTGSPTYQPRSTTT